MSFLTVHSPPLLFKLTCCIIIIISLNLNDQTIAAQNILERFRPTSNISAAGVGGGDEQVKIVSGTKVKRFERFTVPLGGTVNLLQPHHQTSLYYVRPQFDIFHNFRHYVTGWPYYPVRVRLHKAK